MGGVRAMWSLERILPECSNACKPASTCSCGPIEYQLVNLKQNYATQIPGAIPLTTKQGIWIETGDTKPDGKGKFGGRT